MHVVRTAAHFAIGTPVLTAALARYVVPKAQSGEDLEFEVVKVQCIWVVVEKILFD